MKPAAARASAEWDPVERYTRARGLESVQRVELERPLVPPTQEGGRELGGRYWRELERVTGRLVRVRARRGEIRVVLAGVLTLFRFGEPAIGIDAHGVECRYPIRGGLLAARAGGSLAIAQRSGRVLALEVTVRGYHPRLAFGRWSRLRRLLYARVQAPLHLAVGRRFLARAALSPR